MKAQAPASAGPATDLRFVLGWREAVYGAARWLRVWARGVGRP
ncbi:MAG TPA: hypothetical protein VMV21_15995 [Vicinamibacteria bacterium]|nr:hypothetical protein [Vicinamibacteria bacterium]